MQDTSRRQNKKFFDPTIFQKCWRGVGEQPTFAKQITKLHNEMQQKSKRESEESQLPLKLKGCNERQGFRGNCDSQASWGCAPALPNRIRVVFLEELLLGKTVFSVRQKGVPPLLLPASVLQLPRCLVRICDLFHKNSGIENL